jgi:hypothetical protein
VSAAFDHALALYLKSVGTRGEARRLARLAYFAAQDRVPRAEVPALIAACETARLELQMAVAGGRPARAAA